MSLSEMARGKLMVAADEGKAIPLGWALDKGGNPTTDPKAGLKGSMLSAGGVKGAMLALVVELLVTALTGAQMGFEASSFFVEEGGQAPDPGALAGTEVYRARIEALLSVMLQDENVRLPGYRRHDLAHRAEQQGLEVSELTMQKLGKLASKS
jgi:(2R)-3-sulfolactate dehydrogenase (NADP+)